MLIAEIENKYKTLTPPEDRIKKVHPADPAAPVFGKELAAEFSKIHRRTPGVVLRTGDPRRKERRSAARNPPRQDDGQFEHRHGEKRESGKSYEEYQMALIAMEQGKHPLLPGDRVYVESESIAPACALHPSIENENESQPPEKDEDKDFVVELSPPTTADK